MKKLFVLSALLLSVAAIIHAGTPRENLYLGQAPLSHTTIIGSTASVVSNTTVAATVGVTSSTISGPAQSCRNCFTKFVVQIPTYTVVSILDGNTTSYTLFGLGLGASGVNTLSLPEDHLGPLCFTAGNTTTFRMVNTAGSTTQPESFNYEGFTDCGGTYNAGPMQ